MTPSEIIEIILISCSLVSLIVLLFLLTIPMSKEQQKEIKIRTKLYKTLTEYLEKKK